MFAGRKMVSLEQVEDLIAERPRKFSAEDVRYEKAPEGSAIRCASCLKYFKRAVDNFGTCEIFRDEEADRDGVLPDWRCAFWSADGNVYPLVEEK